MNPSNQRWVLAHADRVERVDAALHLSYEDAGKISAEYAYGPCTPERMAQLRARVEEAARLRFAAIGEPAPSVTLEPRYGESGGVELTVELQLDPRLREQLRRPGPSWDGT